jgi:hypothetical protein
MRRERSSSAPWKFLMASHSSGSPRETLAMPPCLEKDSLFQAGYSPPASLNAASSASDHNAMASIF